MLQFPRGCVTMRMNPYAGGEPLCSKLDFRRKEEMAKFRRILALVLVMAMTFSMLPVFAAAEEVVSEIPAVETVEAPAAEAPVVEAPADAPAADAPVVEAPVVDVPAVEDVVEIPTEAPVEEPAVEAIETVATEAVAALQDELSAEDTAAVTEGKIFKILDPTGNVTYTTGLSDALTTACGWTTTGGSVTMLADYVYHGTETSATSSAVYSWKYSPTYETTDTDGLTVKGFWLDLGGNTLSVRRGGPVFGASVTTTYTAPWVNIRNGHIIHVNLLSNNKAGRGSTVNGTFCYGVTSTAPASASKAFHTYTTLKDVDVVTVDYSDSTDKVMKGYATSIWNNTLKLYNAKLLTHNAYGVHFYKSTNSPTGDILTKIQEYGSNYTLELHDGSVVGNYKEKTYAVFYGANKSSTHTGIAHNVTVTADATSMFIGGTLFGQTDQSTYTDAQKYSVNVSLPTGHIGNASFSYAVPSKSKIPAATGYGTAAYYDRGTEKAYSAMRYCNGTVEHIEAKAPTFIAEGNIECWYCADCETYFTDSTLATRIAAADVVVPIRASTDTEGLVDDEDFTALGAIVITTHPTEGTIAYAGASALNSAYKHASGWTTAGGVVKLLDHYTYYNSANGSGTYSNGFIDSGANKANAYGYEIADKDDYSKYGTIKGFWIDLNEKTLVVRSGHGLFGGTSQFPVNIRNGKIIQQYLNNKTAWYATFCHGGRYGPIQSGGVEYTFDNVDIIKVPNTTGSSGSMIKMDIMKSKVNIIDSTIINTNATPIFTYRQGVESDGTANTFTESYTHEVNIYGVCVIGSSVSNQPVFNIIDECLATGFEGDGVFVNIDPEADVTFLGSALESNVGEIPFTCKCGSNEPKYVVDTENKYSFTLPNTSEFANESGIISDLDVVLNGEVMEYQKLKLLDEADPTKATFTTVNGDESETIGLSVAISKWIEAGYTGTIKLLEDLSPESANSVQVLAGDQVSYQSPWTSNGSSPDSVAKAIFALPAAAKNGNLTIDLNGHTITSSFTFVAMDEELEDFTLTIQGGRSEEDLPGTIVSTDGPSIVLQGKGNKVTLNGTTINNTYASTKSWAIIDLRDENSYSVLNASTLTSEMGAAIAFPAKADNVNDASMLYYIKDCSLTGHTNGRFSTATICSLPYNADGDKRPAVNVILDNTTVSGTKTNAGVEAVTVPALEEGETVATTTYQTDKTFAFAKLTDALKAAELLNRNSNFAPAAVALNANATVEAPVAMGTTGLTSTVALDLNGYEITAENGIIEAAAANNTTVTINVTGTLGNEDGKIKVFAHAPAVEYTGEHSFVVSKGAYFDSYSLNLENTISVNLYTKNAPDAVCYVQDGEDKTPVKNADNDWTVTTLAAKDMGKTIDAYAIKTEGNTTTIDFSKGISVKGYVTNKAAEGDNSDHLKNALAAMLIYGKYADKYFDDEFEAIDDALAYVNETGLELTEVPENYDISNITGGRVVTPADLDISSATTGVWGYRGTSAVLADEISMKLYFYGAEFNPEDVTINGAAATEEQVTYKENFTTVKVSVCAAEFDTAITIALNDGEGGHAVTVTDSVAAYAKRLLQDENNSNVHNVAQAMLNYCYYAKQHFNSNP